VWVRYCARAFKIFVNFLQNYVFLSIIYKYSQRHSSSTKSPRKKKKIKIVCNGIRTAATYKPGSRPMRDQYDGTAEYGFLEPLVDSWPVNFPAEYGFRMSNAVDQRSIHHHFTGLTKAITIPKTVHDDWVQARVDCDTFFGGIWLGLNTV
jgi:hypothetical protein